MLTLEFASSIYEKFLSNDDQKIVSIVRKLFAIYGFKTRSIKLHYWLLWRFKMQFCKVQDYQDYSVPVYKKKKCYDIPTNNDNKRKVITQSTGSTLESKHRRHLSDKLAGSTITTHQVLSSEDTVKNNNMPLSIENLITVKRPEVPTSRSHIHTRSPSKKLNSTHERLYNVIIMFW